jgi:uncharacterized protein YndB with AHSA1/START domain
MSNYKTEVFAEKGKQDIRITREFDAPAELVYQAFSEPEHFVQWSKPAHVTLEVEKMDCRTGGSFFLHHHHPNGKNFSFYGVFHEVIPHKSIIKTSEFIGLLYKLVPYLEVTGFEELPGNRTRVSIRIICPDEDYRNGMAGSGMREHYDHAFSLLDGLLKK